MIRRLLSFLMLAISGGFATAQNQYVSTLNYRTVQVAPVAHTPGVSWIYQDNSAYDANHQRYFFQGGTNPQGPWDLYTVDVLTGAMLSSPPAASNDPKGSLLGLHYDNVVDTLYAIFIDGRGNTYLSWIEIATGIAHPKQSFPNLSQYLGSAYDEKDHLYIVDNGTQLVSLDARTGYIVYNATLPTTGQASYLDLVYDNAHSTLFGIYSPGNGPASLGSITLPTGIFHPVAALPVATFPTINAYTVDEASGNFIFVGTLPSTTQCINYRIYAVNIASATIVDSSLYPYAQDPSNPIDSNLLEFSFDNQRGMLYALNWRPTLQTVPPILTVSAGANPTCAGQAEVFKTALTSPFIGTSYQWQVNGQPAGGSTPVYTDSIPNDGDSIRCIVLATTTCGGLLTDTSDAIVLTVRPVPVSSLSITSSANNICGGDTVVFEADPVNGGNAPQYQWLVDGVPAGPSGKMFNSSTLADGDTIRCVMTGSLVCSIPDTSGAVIMSVRPSPTVIMPPDTVIARGQSVPLSPSIQGAVTGYQWEPSAGLSNATIADPVASPENTTIYVLDVSSANGCSGVGKVTINVYTRLLMPGAFTPNGDGHNDVYRIPSSVSVQLISFAVFNRWGQRLFQTSNPSQGWDGSAGGKQAPAGAYIWVLQYVDGFTGERRTARGTVVLVR